TVGRLAGVVHCLTADWGTELSPEDTLSHSTLQQGDANAEDTSLSSYAPLSLASLTLSERALAALHVDILSAFFRLELSLAQTRAALTASRKRAQERAKQAMFKPWQAPLDNGEVPYTHAGREAALLQVSMTA